MKRRLGLIMLALAIVVVASVVQPPRLLTAGAADQQQAFERVPPEVALLSVALGGLNGLLVDYLWLRLTEQQADGRYFEMIQTADWIGALQPRRGRLYAFQAWNLAYNVSLEFSAPADRWRWIESALRILIADGLRWSPSDPEVPAEIARIIDDKVVSTLDAQHQAYKDIWAAEWHEVLGGASPDAALSKPPTADAVLAEPGPTALLAEAEAAGVDLLGMLERRETPEPDSQAARLLADPRHRAALARLRLPIRAFRLREFWRMDAGRMRAIDAEWGPFDWRTGPPHVLYWVTVGLEAAGGPGREKELDRALYQAMVAAFAQGRLVYVPGRDAVRIPWADVRLIPSVERAYNRARALFPDDPSMVVSQRLFLEDAVVYLGAAGRQGEARKRYAVLRREFPDDEEYQQAYETFFVSRVRQLAAGNAQETAAVIQAILVDSFRIRAAGDADQAAMLAGLAALMHRNYVAEAGADANLPALADLRRAALAACWADALPPELRGGLPKLDAGAAP